MIEESNDAWAGEHHSPVFYATEVSQTIASDLDALGFGSEEDSAAEIRTRIIQIGNAEWSRLARKPCAITKEKACWLLGCGYVLTEFLIAPVSYRQSSQSLLSLGAVLNLTACSCDTLLDNGVEIDDLLPQAELFGEQPGTTPVTLLVQQYWHHLDAIGVDVPVRALLLKVFNRMLVAESDSVRLKQDASYCTWLRKSALPIVMMALPAWTSIRINPVTDISLHSYLRWLYRVGQLFGILDDVADYQSDLHLGHLNVFVFQNTESSARVSKRTVDLFQKLIRWWDQRTAGQQTSPVLRQTFLVLVWTWLLPARRHSKGQQTKVLLSG